MPEWNEFAESPPENDIKLMRFVQRKRQITYFDELIFYNVMNEHQKQQIIDSGKEYFRTIIIPNHIKNASKLRLNKFKINPFLINYLAAFLCGDTTPISMAKALVYPRMLGTSINTSFGSSVQTWISQIEQIVGRGSAIPGIDIEFIDQLDGRRKYCQIKAGPQTINRDDVDTILTHFTGLRNIARQNHLEVGFEDAIVGVLYGEGDLTPFYRTINTTYPVYQGAEFWERLTGDNNFYNSLAKAFGQVVEEDGINGSDIIQDAVRRIAAEITAKGGI